MIKTNAWRIRDAAFLLPVCAFLLALTAAGCRQGPAREAALSRIRAAPVVERLVPDGEVSGFGSLSFLTKVDIAAPQDGSLKKLTYREGDFVPAGAELLLLENQQITILVSKAENDVSQAEAALRLAGTRLAEGAFAAEAGILGLDRGAEELDRAKKSYDEQKRKQDNEERLYTAGGISDEAIRESRFNLENDAAQISLMEKDMEIRMVGLRDRDLAAAGLYPPGGFSGREERTAAQVSLATAPLRAEVESAAARLAASRKELDSARLSLSELAVRSPVSGIVGARYFEVGERIKRDEKIITLIDTASLYAIFAVRETEALGLQKGMPAMVKVDGSGKTYKGEVDLVSPQADSQTFTFSVRVLIRETGAELKPGMFARVTVGAGTERSCVAVPESALTMRKGEEASVYVILGLKNSGGQITGTVSERRVRLGRVLPSGKDAPPEREILSGLSAGETAADNPGILKEGASVILENDR